MRSVKYVAARHSLTLARTVRRAIGRPRAPIKPGVDFYAARRDEIVRRIKAGETYRSIAAFVGISEPAVAEIATNLGLNRRPRRRTPEALTLDAEIIRRVEAGETHRAIVRDMRVSSRTVTRATRASGLQKGG